MSFSKVLSAVDGSASAEHALRAAIELAKTQPGSLQICSVVDPVSIFGHPALDVAERAQLLAAVHEAEWLVASAVDSARAAGVSAEGVVAVGSPAEELSEMARSIGADVIVVGTHGRSGFRRLFMGSVAEALLRMAACPVVVVREAAPERPATAQTVGADRRAPVFSIRLLETSPEHFERLYGEIASYLAGPARRLKGLVKAQLFGSDDATRIVIVAEYASHESWARAQWDAAFGELLEELACNAETLEFSLYRGDEFSASDLVRSA